MPRAKRNLKNDRTEAKPESQLQFGVGAFCCSISRSERSVQLESVQLLHESQRVANTSGARHLAVAAAAWLLQLDLMHARHSLTLTMTLTVTITLACGRGKAWGMASHGIARMPRSHTRHAKNRTFAWHAKRSSVDPIVCVFALIYVPQVWLPLAWALLLLLLLLPHRIAPPRLCNIDCTIIGERALAIATPHTPTRCRTH